MNKPADDNSESPPLPRRMSRRAVLAAMAGVLAAPVVYGYATQVELFWPRFHDFEIAIPGLPAGLAGMRIAHLSDLHVSDIVPAEYIRGVVRRVNEAKPDVVVVTGDLITHDSDYVDLAAEIVASISAPTYVSLGNHDYGSYSAYPGIPGPNAEALTRRLGAAGVTVLRNASTRHARNGAELTIVGLEDLWSGRLDARRAFAGVGGGGPVLALSHNPDTAPLLLPFSPDLILCGHTHGGQVRLPSGPLLLPIENRQWDRGHFRLPRPGGGESQMYVSTGVGYIRRVRLACRPEVPTYVLRGE